ncbi:MAG: RES family NAD+ phosphorylase [Gammaproteobacteria bacterium]|nr:RES family NAD+ phosphorylase [Gammaproteobacteria bacterium]
MDTLFDGITITDFHDDTFRNIVSMRVSENLFDDITDTPETADLATAVEVGAKPHTHTSHQPIIDRPFEEATYHEAIKYPFDTWTKTRYSDGTYGVWYGTDSLQTSIYETVHHWRKGLLEDAGWEDVEGVISERKVYNVRIDAGLLNFLPRLDAFPSLIDPEHYHYTHQIGARIKHDGHPGLISRSARCEGTVYAIFNARVLSNPRPACFLSYRIESGSVSIERQPGEIILRI